MQIVKDMAGWRTILIGEVAIHLWTKRDHGCNLYGYFQSWYDGPVYDIGFGRLFLICWRGK